MLWEEKLKITVAGGQTATINNPLAHYTYQAPIPPDFEDNTSEEVCLERAHIMRPSEVFITLLCRLKRRRISRNGPGPIDMLQAR